MTHDLGQLLCRLAVVYSLITAVKAVYLAELMQSRLKVTLVAADNLFGGVQGYVLNTSENLLQLYNFAMNDKLDLAL